MLYELMANPSKLPLPSIKYLKERYEIDPLTGIGKYKINIPNNGIKVGDLVKGRLKKANKGVYKYVSIDGQDYAWHRICYAIYHGKDPFPLDVDHKNLNKLDASNDLPLIITFFPKESEKSLFFTPSTSVLTITLLNDKSLLSLNLISEP